MTKEKEPQKDEQVKPAEEQAPVQATEQQTKAKDEGKEKKAKPTPEETEQNKKRFMAAMGYGEDPDAEKEKADKEKADKEKSDKAEKEKADKEQADKEKSDKESKEKQEEKPKPAKERKPRKPVRDEEDDDTRIEEAADRAAQKVLEGTQKVQPAQEPKQDDFESTLPLEYRRDLEVLRRMEQDNPTAKGVVDRTLAFYKKEDNYIDQWEKDNPGKEFNAEDPEHEEFYAQTPKFDNYAFDRAKETLIEERAVRRAEEKQTERETKFRAELAIRDAEPEIRKAGGEAVYAMLNQVHNTIPDALKSLVEKVTVDGKEVERLVLTKETTEKLLQEDEFLFDLLNENSEKVRVLVEEVQKLVRFGKHYPEDFNKVVEIKSSGEKIYPHQFLHQHAISLEQELAKMPVDETLKDGKKFITQDGYRSRLEKIRTSNLTPNQKESALKDLDGRYWVLTGRDVERSIIAEFADQSSRLAAKHLGAGKKKAGNTTQNGSTENGDANTEKTAKPKAPSVSSSSDKLNTQSTPTTSTRLTADVVEKSMWG